MSGYGLMWAPLRRGNGVRVASLNLFHDLDGITALIKEEDEHLPRAESSLKNSQCGHLTVNLQRLGSHGSKAGAGGPVSTRLSIPS